MRKDSVRGVLSVLLAAASVSAWAAGAGDEVVAKQAVETPVAQPVVAEAAAVPTVANLSLISSGELSEEALAITRGLRERAGRRQGHR